MPGLAAEAAKKAFAIELTRNRRSVRQAFQPDCVPARRLPLGQSGKADLIANGELPFRNGHGK